ncbi:hypothetical protein ACHAWF_009738 [Thalassiosira exigua]
MFSILAATMLSSGDSFADAKDVSLEKSVMPKLQLSRRLLEDAENPRAQRLLQSLPQECIDSLKEFYEGDNQELVAAQGSVAFGTDCLDSKTGGCVLVTQTDGGMFVAMDYTGVDFGDPKYAFADACAAAGGGGIVKFPDFSGIICDRNGTKTIMSGINYQDCHPSNCPVDGLDEEDFAYMFELTTGFEEDCTTGGPEPPKPACESFCSDGLDVNADTQMTNSEGETVSLEVFGGNASEVLTCGWIYENQANNAMLCPFEKVCCGGEDDTTLELVSDAPVDATPVDAAPVDDAPAPAPAEPVDNAPAASPPEKVEGPEPDGENEEGLESGGAKGEGSDAAVASAFVANLFASIVIFGVIVA